MSKLVRPINGTSEAEGRKVLKAAFTDAGYEIVEDYKFVEDGVEVTFDGFDPKRRVGYEYLTPEMNDKADFTDKEIGKLLTKNAQGKVHVLMIDGDGKPDPAMIEYLAKKFLKELMENDKTVA
jgi:hypothetical protein